MLPSTVPPHEVLAMYTAPKSDLATGDCFFGLMALPVYILSTWLATAIYAPLIPAGARGREAGDRPPDWRLAVGSVGSLNCKKREGIKNEPHQKTNGLEAHFIGQ